MQKLAEICVRRPVFATMLILSLTVVGAFSFFSLGVDLFPKIDFGRAHGEEGPGRRRPRGDRG